MNPDKCGGSWTKNNLIYIANWEHLNRVMKYYNIKIDKMMFLNWLLTHELAHEIYRNVLTNDDKTFYKKLTNTYPFLKMTLEYLATYTNNPIEEQFCEFVATVINTKLTPDINRLKYLDIVTNKVKLNKNEFIICGSGLLVVYGLLPSNNDLDLCVTQDTMKSKIYNNKYFKPRPIDIPSQQGMYQSINGGIDVGPRFGALNMSFNELKKHTVIIDDYMFMNTDILLKFYKTLNRPKDQEKIKLVKILASAIV